MKEDLGIKIGTEQQIIWENVFKETSKMIEDLEKGLIIQKAIKELAEKKISLEKKKLFSDKIEN